MSTQPLVSVVIPVYNRRAHIMDAVESVLGQTHATLECVVVDDGSTDGSAEVVVRSTSDPRVVVHSQPNAGVSAARNAGISRVRGRYVTFLDSDDVMLPTRIQRQLELLSERSCQAIIVGAQCTEAPGLPMPSWLAARPEWHRAAYWTSVLTETALSQQVGGFDETMSIAEDIDFLIRIRGAGISVAATDEVLTVRRFFGDNLSWDLVVADGWAVRDAVRRHIARRRAAG